MEIEEEDDKRHPRSKFQLIPVELVSFYTNSTGRNKFMSRKMEHSS